ncbi:MAG: beta-lactamase family protein [Clostridiales bacterium]|nr:beta-lactamase family protein [Clostridiales bacterium]
MKIQEKIKHAVLITVFSFILASCLKDEPMKIPFQSYSPHNLDDGWIIAEPADAGMDSEALKEVYRYVHTDGNLWQIRSLLVFRNDKLIAESYMKNSGDRTTPRAIWSCTKQVVGILTGIAVDKGLISINETLLDCLPQVSGYPEKSMITVENLLMMKSGVKFENDGSDGGPAVMSREEPASSLDYIFGLKMHAAAGTQYKYKDGDPHIVSAIIQERVGKTTRDWAQEVLFNKIGIRRLEWLNYKDGITMGGYGIKTTPRELGKIGQLILNGGKWGSEQIVSEDWLDAMTSEKVSADETGRPDLAFGYLWWKDTKRNLNCMWGRGGQLVMINKEKNLIVVITSETNTSGDFDLSIYDGVTVYDRINSITH